MIAPEVGAERRRCNRERDESHDLTEQRARAVAGDRFAAEDGLVVGGRGSCRCLPPPRERKDGDDNDYEPQQPHPNGVAYARAPARLRR